MPEQFEIDALGNALASAVTAAENSLPPLPEVPDQGTMDNVIRPHMMKRGFATGIGNSLDPPWVDVAAANSSDPLAAKFAPGWLNKGLGWAVAASRRSGLTRIIHLRGHIFSNGTNPLILTLPPLLLPAQNEIFATVIDFQPAYIHVWIDGTVSVNYAEATTRQAVTLSGISYEAMS